MDIIIKFGIFIVAGIYWLAGQAFKVFLALASGGVIDSSTYRTLVENAYVIIGVVLLFVLAFALLKGMINPEDQKQGTSTVKKVIVNLITSSIMLALLPTIFTFMFDFQAAVINNENSIGKFFGYGSLEANENEENTVTTASFQLVNGIFTAFLNVDDEYCTKELGSENYDILECQQTIKADNEKFNDVVDKVSTNGNFYAYTKFSGNAVEPEKKGLSFNFIMALIGGLLLIYVAISFCFDMAIRLIKLLFYQVIAPLPLFFRIMPDGKLSGTFNQWLKVTLTCYLEVFIRVLILYFVTFLAVEIGNNRFFAIDGYSGFFRLLLKAFIYMGLVMFMRQAPKLFSEVTGLDSGNMKLGIREKLKDGGFFAAANAVGQTIAGRGNPLATLRGLKYGWKNGDFKGIGTEAKRYQDYKEKRDVDNMSRKDILMNTARGWFGFDTTADSSKRRIENQAEAVKNRTNYDVNGLHFDENNRLYDGNLFNDKGEELEYRNGKYYTKSGAEYDGQLYSANKQKVYTLVGKNGMYFDANNHRYKGTLYTDKGETVKYDFETKKYRTADGKEYTGDLYGITKNSLRLGKDGKYYDKSGREYTGDFYDSTGSILRFDIATGKYIDKNGKVYTGSLYGQDIRLKLSGIAEQDIMWDKVLESKLETVTAENISSMARSTDKIRALDKLIAIGEKQKTYKQNMKSAEAESKIDEAGSKVKYEFKYKDASGTEKSFVGSYAEIEEFRKLHLTAEQNNAAESMDIIRDKMIEQFIGQQFAIEDSNRSTQEIQKNMQFLIDTGGYTYKYEDKETGAIKEGKITVRKDESTGSYIMEQEVDGKVVNLYDEYFAQKAKTAVTDFQYIEEIQKIKSKGLSKVEEDKLIEEFTQKYISAQAYYKQYQLLDKLAKESNGILGIEKQHIEETEIDAFKGANETVENINKQAKEQKDARLKSSEQKAREAAKTYHANRGK